ncbi:glycosyltransferase family 4 protein [Candidatus Pacearchaeota archaeon]|nr:glycosyltransferase family 4 protein [Candidatus Pacearchaeota archaeon]
MVKDNFGREIRLFEQLTNKYEVHFLCTDFHLKQDFITKKNDIQYYVVPSSLMFPLSIIRRVKKLIKKNRYDYIIPTTEPLLGIIGYYYAKKYNIPIIYEVQDNYEIYDTYKIPFIRKLDYNVIKKSDAVFFSNYALMNKLRFLRNETSPIIENGVDLDTFKIIPKKFCRKKLNIDQKTKLITYTGHISKDRGIDKLIQAVKELREKDKTFYLLLSGKIDKGMNIKYPFVLFKALPKKEELVMALNASDILIIASTDNPFTKYSFPQKLLEYMAVNVPIVATAVGDVVRILKPFKGSLCKPGSIQDLKNKILLQLNKKMDYRKEAMKYTWKVLSKRLDNIIKSVK